MSQIRAKIAQQEYLLTCPDGQEDLLQQAAAEVDAALNEARQSGHMRSREQAATWVALHTMVELHQLRAQLAQTPVVDADFLQAAQTQSAQLEALQTQQTAVAVQCEALIARLDAALHSSAEGPHEVATPETMQEPKPAPTSAAACDDDNTESAST